MRVLSWCILSFSLIVAASGAQAQQASQATVSVDGLGIDVNADGGLQDIAFTVTLTLDGFFCPELATPRTATVGLQTMVNASSGSASASLSEEQLVFNIAGSQSVTSSYSESRSVVLVVRADNRTSSPTVADVDVTATLLGIQGCPGQDAGGESAAGNVTVTFPPVGATSTQDNGQDMPGASLFAILAMLGVAALAGRRQA